MRYLLVAVALAAGTASAVQSPRTGGEPAASSAGVRVATILDEGGRVDWSAARNLIAFDKLGRDRFFNVYTMTPDGRNQTCLTCDKPQLPNKMTGNPAWHPSGDYIVFQAQDSHFGFGRLTDYFANPGAGINNDVWVMNASGTRFWQLTKVKPRVGGVLHPHFSRDGKKLLWSERIAPRGLWGEWSLRVADFAIVDGVPRISNERTLQPGQQHRMYESHDFSPDGRSILFSGNLERGQDEIHADIYLLNLETGELKNLTNSNDEWDEHAHFSPDGRTIVWMSSKDQPSKLQAAHLKTDFWLMNADGSNKRRLTYFNAPGHPEYIEGGAAAADNTWSPDGTRICAYLITDVSRGGRIVMIDVNPRPPR